MRINKKYTTIKILIILIIPSLINAGLFNSGDIIFSVNQKDYYFKIGENAIVPLEIENTYGKQINGMLSYTLTQEINQGGMHMSSSNTHSTSFSVKQGKSTENLNFGTSNSPSTFSVSLKFSYTEKEPRIVSLNNIKIHFVLEESQKQNQENKQTSSSEKYSQQKSQHQDPFSQMQKEIDEMFKNQQTTQQKMQNNQIGQDSSALKKQIQRQLQKQQQFKEQFQKNLEENEEFQQEHQKLLQQGYNLTSVNLNPTSESSGKFDLQYQKQNGETAQLKGEMENGEIKNMQRLTTEDKNQLIKKLQENKEFQKLDKELQEKNFEQKTTEFSLEENKTSIKVNYKNPQNQTQTISAEVINGTIQNVKIENLSEEENKNYFLLWLIILVLLLITGYFIYKKYYKKIKKDEKEIKEKIITEKSFDYKGEAKKLLDKSKILFEKEKYKDAYEKAGQALRLYLSYKHGLKKEITNDEIIRFLKNKNKDIKSLKECFDLCSLVEFAKYRANKKDFDKIIKFGERIINN